MNPRTIIVAAGLALSSQVLADGPLFTSDVTIQNGGPQLILNDTFGADTDWKICVDSSSGCAADQDLAINWTDPSPSSSGRPFVIQNGTGDNLLFLDANDRIGINTSVPDEELDIRSLAPAIRLDDTSAGQGQVDLDMSIQEFAIQGNTGNEIVEIDTRAPSHSLTINEMGLVGVGTIDPRNPLHVEKNNGTAQVKVKEEAPGNTLRTLFNLICDQCTPAFRFQQAALIWFFRMLQDGNFAVDFQGSPGNEFIFAQNGNFTIQGVVNSASSRTSKHEVKALDAREVLEKVVALPVSEWSYKTDKEGVRHSGPMAEDFHAAFGLGESNRSISTIDTGGVALAAIQGLNQIVKEKDAEIAAQRVEITKQRSKITDLEKRFEALEAGQDRLAELEEMLRKLAGEEDMALR